MRTMRVHERHISAKWLTDADLGALVTIWNSRRLRLQGGENTIAGMGQGMADVAARGSILIVDEDASLANFLSQELQCEGFEVEVAA